MDFHPVIVHFPIALLAIYCVLEFLRFEFLLKNASWFHLKLFLLLVGGLSALVARQTGELVGEGYSGPLERLIEAHAFWATAVVAIFGLLALAYLVMWAEKDFGTNPIALKLKEDRNFSLIWNSLTRLVGFFMETPMVFLPAGLGLLAITVTGALGGAIVYGPEADIFVSFIYHLLF